MCKIFIRVQVLVEFLYIAVVRFQAFLVLQSPGKDTEKDQDEYQDITERHPQIQQVTQDLFLY